LAGWLDEIAVTRGALDADSGLNEQALDNIFGLLTAIVVYEGSPPVIDIAGCVALKSEPQTDLAVLEIGGTVLTAIGVAVLTGWAVVGFERTVLR
jgi:hypothetical protein